eukprot:TRINITY_DN40357_c0_g1_i1.p1 TRINITY_DN40357_c0_g1~~TRINITY_DN40357_c0_g1_i1.p1  ORF type:complete len:2198 (-),score=442.54 TRINITY_DN40357_c0_g1_i1:83-6196(-)
MVRCAEGATTLAEGMIAETDCLCSPGHYGGLETDLGSCVLCPAGRYKNSTTDSESCEKECPVNSTSGEGARSFDNCFCIQDHADLNPDDGKLICAPFVADTAGPVGQTDFDVPAVKGDIALDNVPPMTQSEREDYARSFADVIASELGAGTQLACTFKHAAQSVTMDCEVVVLTIEFDAAGAVSTRLRRLLEPTDKHGGWENDEATLDMLREQLERRLAGSATLQYTLRQASDYQTKALVQSFQPVSLENKLGDAIASGTIQGTVTSIGTLATTQAATSCPQNKALPPNAAFVSVSASCKCQVGWEPTEDDATICQMCPVGRFKSLVADAACSACPDSQSTEEEGATNQRQCFCVAGTAYTAGGTTCLDCPIGSYCPFDSDNYPDTCPQGSETIATRMSRIEDCRCSKGYGGSGISCSQCQSGTYKDRVDSVPCSICPPKMSSEIGASESEQCYCQRNTYLSAPGTCSTCTSKGISCEGGFVNGTTDKHQMPYALEGYYLTGTAMTKACSALADGNPICLGGGGGGEEIPCRSNCSGCIEGHDGFVCQTCKPGWTRDIYSAQCQPCDRLPDSWLLILQLNMGIITLSLFAHVQTVMAILASEGEKSLHSALFRLLQNWMLSMSVLKMYDFSKVEMFSWGQEQVELEMAARRKNNTEEEEVAGGTDMSLQFPDWFHGLSSKIFAVDFSFEVGTPTEAIECLVERSLGVGTGEHMKHVGHAIYWVAYPLALILWTLIIDIILVYAIWPPLKSTGIIPPADPKEKREWTLKKCEKSLKQNLIKNHHMDNEDELTDVSNMVTSIILLLSTSVKPKALVIMAKYPMDCLQAIGNLLEKDLDMAQSLQLAKQAVLNMSKPAFERALEENPSENEDLAKILEHEAAWTALSPCLQELHFIDIMRAVQHPGSFVSRVCQLLKDTDEGRAKGQLLQIAFLWPKFRHVALMEGFEDGVARKVWKIIRKPLSKLPRERQLELFHDEALKRPGALARMAHAAGPGSGDALVAAAARPELLTAMKAHLETPAYLAPDVREKYEEETFNASLLAATHVLSAEAMKGLKVEGENDSENHAILAIEIALEDSAEEALQLLLKASEGTAEGALLRLHFVRSQLQQQFEDEGQDPDEAWRSVVTNVMSGKIRPFVIQSALNKRSFTGLAALGANAAATGAVALGVGVGGATLGGASMGLLSMFTGGVGDDFEVDQTGMMAAQAADAANGSGGSGGTNQPRYAIFLLFREWPSPAQFLLDIRPLLLLLLYSTWFETTRQLLLLIHCDPFTQQMEDGSVGRFDRWMKHTDYVCFSGDHIMVALLGAGGLLVWSLGFIVALALAIDRKKKQITEPGIARLFSFFIMGYEQQHCNWDVIVKRMDIFCTIIITYTNVAADLKAKLLCYAALAAVMLVLHADYKPFENRKNGLLDRIEYYGLIVRFGTFTVVELLLIFNPTMTTAIIACIVVVLMCSWYMINLWTNIAVELSVDIGKKNMPPGPLQASIQTALEDVEFKHQKANPIYLAKRLAQKVVAVAKTLALSVALVVVMLMKRMEESVLKFAPRCVGFEPSLHVLARKDQEVKFNCCVEAVWGRQLAFFRQTDDDQRDFLSMILSSLFEHIIGNLKEDDFLVGNGIVGQFVVCARALKAVNVEKIVPSNSAARVKADALLQKLAWAVSVHNPFDEVPGRKVGSIRNSFAEAERMAAEEAKSQLCAEDLNDMLSLLQSTPKATNIFLLKAAFEALEVRRSDLLKQQSKDISVQTMPLKADLPFRKLTICVLRARGLRHVGATGECLWCVVETVNGDGKVTKRETRMMNGSVDPEWHEELTLEPWYVGDSLQISIWDQMTGNGSWYAHLPKPSRLGEIIVPSPTFFPQGFEGELPLMGCDRANLTLSIVPEDATLTLEEVEATAAKDAEVMALSCTPTEAANRFAPDSAARLNSRIGDAASPQSNAGFGPESLADRMPSRLGSVAESPWHNPAAAWQRSPRAPEGGCLALPILPAGSQSAASPSREDVQEWKTKALDVLGSDFDNWHPSDGLQRLAEKDTEPNLLSEQK